jgi:hypothetical protein
LLGKHLQRERERERERKGEGEREGEGEVERRRKRENKDIFGDREIDTYIESVCVCERDI